jgi:hypothetical protein
MTTNAQAALQAASTHYSTVHDAGEPEVLDAAGRFKDWLDEQDESDRKMRHSKNVGPARKRADEQIRSSPSTIVVDGGYGMIPPLAQAYPSTPQPYPGAQTGMKGF